jgi:hypothetical protein
MVQRNATSSTDSSAHARQLLDLVNGSWISQATYVAAYLGIPDLLSARAMSSEELARATGAHGQSLRRLMRALVTIDLCREQREGLYELTPMGALLRADVADSLRSWVLYWGGPLRSIWGNLLHSVMTGENAGKLATGGHGFDRLEVDPETAAVFNRAMVELTRLDASAIAQACDLTGVERIVDVGGGYGGLLTAILQAHPALVGVLFDRLHAIENGSRHMEAAGVASRCEFVVGNFFESIPSGADAYVLKSVIHDWNDERGEVILQNCRRAMHERAKLLLVERIVPMRLEASPPHKAIARSDLNMLVGLGGQERTEDEYRILLTATGFRVKPVLRAGPVFSIIEATRLR